MLTPGLSLREAEPTQHIICSMRTALHATEHSAEQWQHDRYGHNVSLLFLSLSRDKGAVRASSLKIQAAHPASWIKERALQTFQKGEPANCNVATSCKARAKREPKSSRSLACVWRCWAACAQSKEEGGADCCHVHAIAGELTHLRQIEIKPGLWEKPCEDRT